MIASDISRCFLISARCFVHSSGVVEVTVSKVALLLVVVVKVACFLEDVNVKVACFLKDVNVKVADLKV